MKFFLPCFLRLGLLLGLAASSMLPGGVSIPSFAAVNIPGHMTLRDGKLTARIAAAPIRQVLEEVSSLTGARVLWLGQEEEGRVSVEFTDLPFPDALRKILGERNFMLFYTSRGEETRLSEIWISSASVVKEQALSLTPPSPADQLPPQLMQTALYGQDLTSRLNAIRRLKKFAQKDARVKTILSQLTRSAAEPEVQEAAEKALAEIQ